MERSIDHPFDGLLPPQGPLRLAGDATALLVVVVGVVMGLLMSWVASAQPDTAQPPTQPQLGPMARVIHENVVPQSGSARFM